MKIAVPSRANQVDSHFGHCEAFSIFTIDESKNITNKELLPSTQGCGCKSNIASVLQQMGVSVMLAGNMGEGAVNVLAMHNMQVVRGCQGDVDAVVNAFLHGELTDNQEVCSHHGNHEDGHSCGH